MCFFFFSVETLLEAPLVVLWLGGKKKKLDGVFFSEKHVEGPQTLTWFLQVRKSRVEITVLEIFPVLGMGEITKLMERTLGRCFLD